MKAALDNSNVVKTLQEYIGLAENVKYGAQTKVLVDAELFKDALNLIISQKAENETLIHNLEAMAQTMQNCAKAERAEAFKEFADGLRNKRKFHYDYDANVGIDYVTLEDIDEMEVKKLGNL